MSRSVAPSWRGQQHQKRESASGFFECFRLIFFTSRLPPPPLPVLTIRKNPDTFARSTFHFSQATVVFERERERGTPHPPPPNQNFCRQNSSFSFFFFRGREATITLFFIRSSKLLALPFPRFSPRARRAHEAHVRRGQGDGTKNRVIRARRGRISLCSRRQHPMASASSPLFSSIFTLSLPRDTLF